ncbi:HD domain-containing protein [Tropicibacter sp. S64]|uniref:HD domain-containing protein n=1 Tax=Tropicibacter sp. S64 TaxID=3415122 RepID=UPI003C79D9F8
MGLIGDAFELALTAHAGQVDKAGAPYIGHVARVAARVPEGPHADTARVVALLHDVVEDTAVTLGEIGTQFGPEIAHAVDALTRRAGETSESYYTRVKSDAHARIVKHADLDDNADPVRLSLLQEDTRARLTAKYASARAALQD